jgi:Uma2 family endonuclease
MTLTEYFRTDVTSLPQELAYGAWRVADAPTPCHQNAVGDFYFALRPFGRRRELGDVWISPIDVILDRENDLVVQPDLIFVGSERLTIVTDHVWGTPDMVLEVLSPHPRIGRLHERLEWFARYGVRECWLFHQPDVRLEILTFDRGTIVGAASFEAGAPIASSVLPGFDVRLLDILSA